MIKKVIVILCISLCSLWLGSCFSAEKGLIAYWNFDEGKGSKIKDLSGNGVDVDIGTGEWTKGKVGSAIMCNGADAILTIEKTEKLMLQKAFSIEAWVKITDLTGYQDIFNDNQFFFRKDSPEEGNKFSLFVKLSDGSVEPRAQAKDSAEEGKWYFVVGIWDGTTAKVYVDGAPAGQSTREGVLTEEIITPTIGGGEQVNPSVNPFNGIIDELKIYNRALSDAEVKTHYETGAKK